MVIASALRPSGGTGVQTHVNQFIDYLRSRDVPVTLVTPFSSGGILRDLLFGVRRLIQPASGAASVWWYRHWHGFFLHRALRRQLDAMDTAVVYCQCPVAAAAALGARRSGQRVVLAVHFHVSQADEWVGKGEIGRHGRVFRSIRRLERHVLDRVDGIVFVSQSAQTDLWTDDLGDVPSATIPNFVLTDRAQRVAARRADLVTVGSLEARKNHTFLLDTLAAAKRRGHRYTLEIAGDGPERRSLVQRARALRIDDQVRLLGYVPNAGSLLPGYRAYLHPAKREVLPLAIIEAMAAGVPVVAAPVGGIPELYDQPVEGLFWDLDDPDRAAELLIGLLEDEPARARMGAAARARFLDRFDAAVVGQSLHSFLTQPTADPVDGPPARAQPIEPEPGTIHRPDDAVSPTRPRRVVGLPRPA